MDEHRMDIPEQGETEDAKVFQQVRAGIREKNLFQAESLLDGVENHCAEWHFLEGAVCYRKGWMDEAQRHYEIAKRMEPENPEYGETAARMRKMKRYRPNGMPAGTLSALPDWAVCGIACAGGYCGCQCCIYNTLIHCSPVVCRACIASCPE